MWIKEYRPTAQKQNSDSGILSRVVISLFSLFFVVPIIALVVGIGVVLSGIWFLLTLPFRAVFNRDWFFYWFKRLFLDRYQKWMWYANITQSEISKPMRFMSETLQIATYLAVIGIVIKPTTWATIYLAIFVVAGVIGKFLLDWGVVKYLTSLGNEHNPEITAIKKGVEDIKQTIQTYGSNTNKV